MACWPKRPRYPDDFAWVKYRLRPDARWHDGKPVTPEDVIFSFNALKQYSPMHALLPACRQGRTDRRTRNHFTFDGPGNRELPTHRRRTHGAAQALVGRHRRQGRKRDISATTLEIPLGSGPYRIKEFAAGRSLVLERVKDYWGENLPVNVGQNNFDQLRFDYFRDNHRRARGLQGRPGRLDRGERSANAWSTALRFPGGARKTRHQGEISDRQYPAGCRVSFSTCAGRLFKDVRLRRAFNYAYDFEEMNRQLSFGEYQRNNSYFDGTELASSGLPEGAGTCRSSKPCATRFRPRSSPRPTKIRSAAIRKRFATICARRRGC